MRILRRYRAFQQEGLVDLISHSQVIETSCGCIEYATQGDGPSILVAHGTFGGFDQSLRSIYFLKDIKTKFIAPSRFGYLRTPMPVDATPEAQAHAYVTLLDTLGIDKACIMGMSGGGMSALQYALQFPHRCWGLVMVSAVSHRLSQPPLMKLLVKLTLTNQFLGWVLRTYLPRLVTQSTGDDYSLIAGNAELEEAVLNIAWPPHTAQRLTGMLNDFRQADVLPNYPLEQIKVPTLVIHGTVDPFVPFHTAENLVTKVAGAKLLALENGGHLSFLTQQEKTRPIILDFIDTNSTD